jgi:hypothetical protein
LRAAFLRRNSSRSMPSSRASRSMWASTAKVTCGWPGARMNPPGTWLV